MMVSLKIVIQFHMSNICSSTNLTKRCEVKYIYKNGHIHPRSVCLYKNLVKKIFTSMAINA